MTESGRVSLYGYVMHVYVHLTEKNEMLKYKISFLRIDYCDERQDYLNVDISDTKGRTYTCNTSI